LKLKF